MTAIQWLVEKYEYKIGKSITTVLKDEIEQAKQMEKEQKEKEYSNGFIQGCIGNDKNYSMETYGSKGSDETKTENMKINTSSLMDYNYHEQRRGINTTSFQSEAPKEEPFIVKVTDATSSQTEISELTTKCNHLELSDEEIEKAFTIGSGFQKTVYSDRIEGAKWYREQLKQRVL